LPPGKITWWIASHKQLPFKANRMHFTTTKILPPIVTPPATKFTWEVMTFGHVVGKKHARKVVGLQIHAYFSYCHYSHPGILNRLVSSSCHILDNIPVKCM
jgi:hypothetical protein